MHSARYRPSHGTGGPVRLSGMLCRHTAAVNRSTGKGTGSIPVGVVSHSLDHHDERFPFFDDIRGELLRGAAADVLRRVDRSGRGEQDVAGLERHWRLALDLVLQRALEDIDDFFTRMRVLAERGSPVEVDARLDDLA